MLIYGTLVSALLGVAAWQGAQPEAQPVDHTVALHNADGSWKYTNRLVDSTSPYLLQHAHNPVDWYPWGAEAFAAAKEHDKPIFLSVGYSTCYWCHVMEREVFENPEIAALMNEDFICIKVDREQRPDIDEVYMSATQLMAQRGGWPMSVFLTPDLKPFYAGTYFGPVDSPGRPGFPTVLNAMSDAWKNRHEDVLATADRAATALGGALLHRFEQAGNIPLTHDLANSAVEQLKQAFDERLGGFGLAPKFPKGFDYSFLLAVYERTGDTKALEMTTQSLSMMASGGMYDQVGGGFARYSTDAQWRVPHFEKMLYNQAQLTRAYTQAYKVTGDEAFADTARGILRYVKELMTGPDGQFYSALDAETDAAEGAYYVWNRKEITSTLSGDDLELFDKAFALEEVPAYPGHKHPDGGALYMPTPITELAMKLDLPYAELRARLDEILAKLKLVRDDRKLPRLDDKVIVGWNGLMIGAYAQAGELLNEPAYTDAARRAGAFVLENMRDSDGDLLRIWRGGISEQPAFLEDYAFVVQGFVSLYRATGEERWLDAAADLADRARGLFWDEQGGGSFFAVDSSDLIARSKSAYDGAIPSGNSAMAHALLDLAEVSGEDRWRDQAQQTLDAFSGLAKSSPRGHIHMVHAVERFLEESLAGLDESGVMLPEVKDVGGALSDSASRVVITADVDSTGVNPGGLFTVRLVVDIAEGWHINANEASAAFLIATTVDVRSDLPIEVMAVEYPVSRRLDAAFSEAPIDVYEGKVEIVVSCRMGQDAAVGSHTLRVLIGFQACDAASCLQPAETIIQIPLEVVGK